MRTNICGRHGVEKQRRGKDGRWVCQLCKSESDRHYAQINRETVLNQKKDYYQRNRGELKAKNKAYYDSHQRAILDWAKQYRQSNAERIKANRAAYYQVNKASVLARNKEYRMNHADRFANMRYRRLFQRRSVEINSVCQSALTAKDLWSLWKRQRGYCALTGRALNGRTPRSVAVDHIVPRVSGGETKIENLQWVVNEANHAKYKLSNQEFIRLCSDVHTYQAGRRHLSEFIDPLQHLAGVML